MEVDMAADEVRHRVKPGLMPDIGKSFVLGFFPGHFLSLRTTKKVAEKHTVLFQGGMRLFELFPQLVACIENEVAEIKRRQQINLLCFRAHDIRL